MIFSYLKFALRQIRLYKTYTVINIAGLSAGLAACFIILVYVRYQATFDRNNENLDNIYIATTNHHDFGWTDPGTPLMLAPTVREEMPEFKVVARVDRIRCTLQYRGRVFEEKRCTFAEPEIFNILSIPLAYGRVDTAGKEKNYLAISESLSKKYFGNSNPIGETITLTCAGGTYELQVTGVMKDLPANSTFAADAIAPFFIAEKALSVTWKSATGSGPDAWYSGPVTTYVLVRSSTDVTAINQKMGNFSKRHFPPDLPRTFQLFPLKDVYFGSFHWVNNGFAHGDISNLYIYSTVAFLLLFIACVNYLMLSLGRASLRTREVGIRKVFGARNSDLFRQTLIEAIVVTTIALPLALVLVELLLQDLTGLLGIAITGGYFHTWEYLLGFVLLTLAVGLVAGSYVSVYLSGFNPIDILKSKLASGSRKLILRRALITSQMIIFLGLTLTALTVYRQLRLFQERDLGFDRENLVLFYPESDGFSKSFDVFKNEVQKNPEVVAISGASSLPMTETQGVSRFPRKGHPDEMVTVEGMFGDRDIIETLGLKMVAGSSFHDHAPGIEARYCILNETAVRELGLTEPVGEQVGSSTVIGVVKDFNMHSFRSKIGPLSITTDTRYVQEIAARIAPGHMQEAAHWVAATGAQFNGGKPLEFETFDSRVGDLYHREQKFARAIGYSTGLAIFVACLGIFGMSLFVAQQKIKEIGIRKVLGASTASVYGKLTKEFVGLILVSSLIAFPIAAYLVKGWLEQFIYRVDIGAPEIAITILVDTAIVLGTVSYQALRAASVNPIESLRYE